MPDTLLDTNALDLARQSAAALTSDPGGDWRDRWTAAAEAGLLSYTMPDVSGASARDHVLAMMELGRLVPDNGLTLGLGTHIWTVQQPLVTFGTADQRAAYLPDLTAGRRIGAYALTEPGSGSDAMGLETRAERTEDGYVLNGEKTYIGMGPCFDVALVFASTAPEKKAWGVSVFVVHAEDAGITRGPVQEKLGLKTLPMGKLRFDNCHIPEDRRLGPEGAGARIFQATLDWERAFILAAHVGAMARQLDESATFARTRHTFGKPILEHQSVSNRLADMAIRHKTARLMLLEAAAEYDAGRLTSDLAAMVNLHISEGFLASSIDSMRNFGGAGYLAGAQAGADITDALGGVIYSGTSDVEKQIVAKMAAQKAGRTT